MSGGYYAHQMRELVGDADNGLMFEDYLLKGQRLLSRLYCTVEEAQSEFLEFDDLKKNGWIDCADEGDMFSSASYKFPTENMLRSIITGFGCETFRPDPTRHPESFSEIQMSLDEFPEHKMKDAGFWHDQDWMHRVGGRYRFCLASKIQYIWTKLTISPSHARAKAYSMLQSQLPDPPLKHLSDVLFLAWKETVTPARAGPFQHSLLPPKSVIVGPVFNNTTKAILTTGLALSGLSRWSMDKATISSRALPEIQYGFSLNPDEDLFKALLASPSGTAVAHMLLQHRQAFGHQVVKRIRVYNFKTSNYPVLLYLVFDIGPASGYVPVARKSEATVEST